MSAALPICVATLTGPNAVMLRALYKDNVLVMDEPTKYAPTLTDINDNLVPSLRKLASRGMLTIVDEVSGDVSKATGANRVRLSDKHHTGSPVISVALERYNELKRTKAIILPKTGGRFEIPPSIVDVSFNSSGEAVYNIAWAEIKAEHILTILCCYATFYQPVGSAGYIKKMMSALHPKKAEVSTGPEWITEAVIKKDIRPVTLAGTRHDEDTIIL
ncbi:TPA: hypothetical protein ACSTLU_004384 [Serratia fonticola]